MTAVLDEKSIASLLGGKHFAAATPPTAIATPPDSTRTGETSPRYDTDYVNYSFHVLTYRKLTLGRPMLHPTLQLLAWHVVLPAETILQRSYGSFS